jgi:glycosyltransferase involved in cell wall biosynthesis
MPVYNGSRYVAQAIDSVLAQTFRDFEFLIINDGSKDDSLSILRRYEGLDERVRLIDRPNTGVVRARNELIRAARGEFLALIDQDDMARPERLALQVEAFDRDASLVAVGSSASIVDPDGAVLGFGTPPATHDAIDDVLMTAPGGWHILSPSAMLRTRAVVAVGLYREGFDYSEDADLFLRLAEVGRLANLPQRLLSYRVHLESGSHLGTVAQRDSHHRAAVEAARRRGVAEPPAPAKSALSDMAAQPSRTHVMWAWWALDSGHLRTARKHALVAVRRAPLDRESWRVAYCSMRGTKR